MSLIFACCFLYNYFSKYRYFKILEISTSHFMEGAKKHAQSLFRIKLVTKRAGRQIIFDELWIEDRLYKIKITNEENQQIESHFTEKQILYIDVDSEVRQPSAVPPPEKAGSRIFLGYQVGSKRKYCPINEFPELSVA